MGGGGSYQGRSNGVETMTQKQNSGIKPLTVLKLVGLVVVVILAIIMWDNPSRRGRGTVGNRVVASALAIGLLSLPVVAVSYLLSRRKKRQRYGGDDDLPTRRD